ncbi:MAG: DUF1848 domain-containing protein [Treponema sp.]|nr:DUF1848 domain-containing protein [Treponema sp.]
MLLFASGRTDIPAFYAEWFMNRLRAGFVDVRNPYSRGQVTRYRLSPDVVDCLVFCTKNPAPILPYLDELCAFGVYFFVTITPYGTDIEPNVPEKNQVMDAFTELSAKLGPHRVSWRYDPVFVDSTYTVSSHIRSFRMMAERLSSATDRCIISFIDLYEKTKRNFPGVTEVNEADQRFLAQAFAAIGRETGIHIESCAEKLDLSDCGIEHGACVSASVVETAAGIRLRADYANRRQHLRSHCGCLPTNDIGAYNSCPHLCRYCYANYDPALVIKNHARHNPGSSFLIGGAQPDDVLHEAKQVTFRDSQLLLL